MTGSGVAEQQAVRGGMWLAASNLITLLAMTLLSVVLGRFLGPEELGRQGYVTYVAFLFTALLVLSLNNMAIQVLGTAHGQGDAARTALLSRWFQLAQMLGGLVAAGGLLAFGRGGEDYVLWVLVALTAAIDGAAWGLVSRVVAASGWSGVAPGRLVLGVCSAGLGVFAVVVGWGVVGVLAMNALAVAGFLVWVRRRAGALPPGHWLPLPWAVARLWPVFLLSSVLGQIVNQRFEVLFLGRYSTPDRLAMYSISFMVVSAAIMIPASVIGGSMPSVARAVGAGLEREASHQLGVAVRVVTVAASMIAAAVAGLGPPLVAFVYGAEFLEAARLTILMAPTVVVASAATMIWSFSYGAGRLRVPIVSASIAATAELAVAFLLIARFGPPGAAIANLTGQVVLFVALTVLARRAFPTFTLRFTPVLPAVAWAVVIALAIVFVVRQIGLTPEVNALKSLLVGSLVFLVGVLAPGSTVGLLNATDGAWFRSALPDALARYGTLVTGRRRRRDVGPGD